MDHCLSDCGGLQTGEGGAIASPNYPNIYPGPSRCAWLLEAPVGHTITVSLNHGDVIMILSVDGHSRPPVLPSGPTASAGLTLQDNRADLGSDLPLLAVAGVLLIQGWSEPMDPEV